jgi:hypothetical protein
MKMKRERKKTDLQSIDEATYSLVASIVILAKQNNELVEGLIEEQSKNLKFLKEKVELTEEIKGLKKKVGKLESESEKLIKKNDTKTTAL